MSKKWSIALSSPKLETPDWKNKHNHFLKNDFKNIYNFFKGKMPLDFMQNFQETFFLPEESINDLHFWQSLSKFLSQTKIISETIINNHIKIFNEKIKKYNNENSIIAFAPYSTNSGLKFIDHSNYINKAPLVFSGFMRRWQNEAPENIFWGIDAIPIRIREEIKNIIIVDDWTISTSCSQIDTTIKHFMNSIPNAKYYLYTIAATRNALKFLEKNHNKVTHYNSYTIETIENILNKMQESEKIVLENTMQHFIKTNSSLIFQEDGTFYDGSMVVNAMLNILKKTERNAKLHKNFEKFLKASLEY